MFEFRLSSPQTRITISNNYRGDCEIRSRQIGNEKSCLPIEPFSSEAQKIINQNGNIVFPILVITFLAYSLLSYGVSYDLVPLAQDIVEKMKTEGITHDIVKDLRHVFVLELVKWLCSIVIGLFFLMATVLFASEVYSGKKINTKELVSMMNGSNKWKRVVITFICTFLISISFVFIIAVFVGIIANFSKGHYLLSMVIMILLLVLIFYLYMSAIWILSLVISVLEEISGFKAISRAEKLMKGKKIQGCALMLNYMIGCGVIYVVSLIVMRKVDLAIEKPLIVVIPRIFFICLLKLFTTVMYTVFYQESKKDEAADNQLCSYGPIDSANYVSANEEQYSSGQYGQYSPTSSIV